MGGCCNLGDAQAITHAHELTHTHKQTCRGSGRACERGNRKQLLAKSAAAYAKVHTRAQTLTLTRIVRTRWHGFLQSTVLVRTRS